MPLHMQILTNRTNLFQNLAQVYMQSVSEVEVRKLCVPAAMSYLNLIREYGKRWQEFYPEIWAISQFSFFFWYYRSQCANWYYVHLWVHQLWSEEYNIRGATSQFCYLAHLQFSYFSDVALMIQIFALIQGYKYLLWYNDTNICFYTIIQVFALIKW